MKPTLTPPPCACCGQTAELVPKLTRFRRGERVLPVEGYLWRCAHGCVEPDTGDTPYEFSTPALMAWEEARAAEAWLERFGEPMPPSKRAQQVAARRTVRVPVLLTRDEAARLDELRGDRPRGEFLRQLLSPPSRRVG